MKTIAGLIAAVINAKGDDAVVEDARETVGSLCESFPLYPELERVM